MVYRFHFFVFIDGYEIEHDLQHTQKPRNKNSIVYRLVRTKGLCIVGEVLGSTTNMILDLIRLQKRK